MGTNQDTTNQKTVENASSPTQHRAFSASPPPVKAYEVKAVHRCWFHLNFGRPFDTSWCSDEYGAIHHQTPSEPNHAAHDQISSVKPDRDSSNANLDANGSAEPSFKPRRQLTTLLSPLWTPIRRLSALKASGSSDSATSDETRTKGPTNPQSAVNSANRSASPPLYRSSFSQTPLVYTHCIRHAITLVEPFLPSNSVVQRLLTIMNRNMPTMPQSKLHQMSRLSMALDAAYRKTTTALSAQLHLTKPFYLRWNDHFGIKVVLGTPPPAMSSKP